jgi:hypothetical protein
LYYRETLLAGRYYTLLLLLLPPPPPPPMRRMTLLLLLLLLPLCSRSIHMESKCYKKALSVQDLADRQPARQHHYRKAVLIAMRCDTHTR